MDVDYQPWQDVAPIDDAMKRRLGINLPQLLSPLAETPLPGPRPAQPPLSTSASSQSLAVPPTPKPPLAEAMPTSTYDPSKSPMLPQTPPTPLSTFQAQNPAGEPRLKGAKSFFDTLARSFPLGAAIEGAIPGSPGNYERRLGAAEKQTKAQADIADIQSQTEERGALADKARRTPIDKPENLQQNYADAVADAQRRNVDPSKDPKVQQWADAITAIQKESTQKPDTQTQNKERFQGIIAKVDAARLPTDPKSLPKSLDAARQRGSITPEEHQTASGYLAANPTPSTTVQVQTIGKETSQDIKDANTYYRWTDAGGKVRTGKGGKVPKGADAEPIGNDKEYATHLREAGAANIVQQSLNRIAQDVDEHPEIFDNPKARAILATTLEQIDRTSANMLIAGTGGAIPLPSGLGDIINTALQNDSKTGEALKQYIADYKAMKDKGIVQQMEMQGGKIGRGSQQVFQSIIDQIPSGKTADSTTARRQIANLQATQDRLMSQYRDDGKEQAYKMKSGGGGGQRQPVVVNGKTIGYATKEEFDAGKMYQQPQ